MPNVPLDDLVELSSEFRFQTVFDHLAVGSTITAPDGRWLRVNSALTELLGYDEAELVGRSFQSLTHPDDLGTNSELLRRAVAGEIDRYRMEKRFLHARGHVIWVQLTTSVVRDATGKARYFISQYEDMTERRAAQVRLGESEERYRAVIDTAHEGICTVDTVGRITYANRRLAGMLGYASEELVSHPLFDFMEPASAFDARTHFARRQRGIAERVEVALHRKDGTTLWALSSASSLFGADGAFTGAVYLLTDVTERRAAERRLAESERYFRALTEQSGELVCVLDAGGVIRYVNPGFSRVLGYDVDVVGHGAFELVHDDDVARLQGLFAALLERPGGSVDATYRVRSRDGAVCVLTGIAQNLLDDPAVRGIVVNAQDVTERSRAHEALRESEARFQNIVNNVPGMVYQWTYGPDWSGGYTYVSEGSRTLFGIAPEEALRDPEALLGMIPSADREVLRERARDAATRLVAFRWEGRAILPTGAERVIQIAAHDQRLSDGSVLSDGVVMDVTELRVLEQQLRHAQKMEAVGQLAGGIAHDFNNLLTVISTSTAMALEALPDGASETASDLTEVRKAADRAADLTRQLLAFGRKQMLQPQLLDTNATVTEVAGMLRRVIGEDIIVELELGGDLWPILADPGQLSQVLMNLAVNARDAMPGGGTLRLMTANTTISPADAHDESGLAPGDYVAIGVEDSGTGIDSAVLPHIFEPFYTTKEPGHGTGLGLATVYGIVKQSGGYVSVDSTLGIGTSFTVLLPRADELPTPRGATATSHGLEGGTETILLVEDERAVRRAVLRMLRALGYAVLEAESAADALRLAAQADASGTRVHLVLTDVVMPEQGGRALGERLAAFWPGIPVVYMSGYTDDEIFRRGLRQSRFLEKPFTAEQLARTLRDALDTDSR